MCLVLPAKSKDQIGRNDAKQWGHEKCFSQEQAKTKHALWSGNCNDCPQAAAIAQFLFVCFLFLSHLPVKRTRPIRDRQTDRQTEQVIYPWSFSQNCLVQGSLATASASDPGSMSVSKSNTSENASHLRRIQTSCHNKMCFGSPKILPMWAALHLHEWEFYVDSLRIVLLCKVVPETLSTGKAEQSRAMHLLRNHKMQCQSCPSFQKVLSSISSITGGSICIFVIFNWMNQPEKSIEMHFPPPHWFDTLKFESTCWERVAISVVTSCIRMDGTLQETYAWNLNRQVNYIFQWRPIAFFVFVLCT